MGRRRDRKGTFSDRRLPVARRYLYPSSRRGLLVLGGIAVAALAAWTAIDFTTRDARFLSSGPLSSNHATFENDCAACHRPFEAVSSDACSVCHEKYGDELGVYSFASHYLYRSNDFQRLVPSEHETACAACHPEHLGRDADVTRVEDGKCLTCHDFGSFHERHPQFDFAADGASDDDALAFAHGVHTRRVMERQGLLDHERACLTCHNPRPDGKSFEPISFDRHCDACHLSASESTPRLPIFDPEEPDVPGVATVAELRQSSEPGTRWALYANPAEFRQAGPLVAKSPLHHEDPWVLENLRRLRRRLYPDAGLADLLTATADAPASELRPLYEEAVATLEDYALGLRSRPEPEIQQQLEQIDRLLARVRRALEDPTTPLDESALLLALDRRPRADLGAEQVEELEQLVADLTAACRQCHRVEAATIARVQEDQRVLRRAEFNHRAHILQARCLECHAEIPILESLDGEPPSVDPESDRSAIHNLPTIERCQQCHTPQLASERCVTCHLFHPDNGRRSHLLLYLDEDEQAARPASGQEG